jgi:hypothetical protein
MRPGHPVGGWHVSDEPGRLAPTPGEMGEFFDEQDLMGQLSHDAWLALRRLATSLDDEPIQYGALLCRPDPEDFDPALLEDQLTDARFEALVEGGAEPTGDEIMKWQAAHMELAHADAAGGLYTAQGWHVRDDRGRQRVLVTLHVDAGSFEQVAGLFHSEDEAEAALQAYGDFEWLW